MQPQTVFQYCSTIAMVGWILLIIFPNWFRIDKFIIGIIVTLFAIVYTWLLFDCFHFGDFKKFGSLDGVMELFKNPVLVTAGWVHYLAFDLMTGVFIKKNSVKHGISHWLVIPCLFLTFMVGPAGLLLYLLLRVIITKQYFATNY
jgi:hypothetical protein